MRSISSRTSRSAVADTMVLTVSRTTESVICSITRRVTRSTMSSTGTDLTLGANAVVDGVLPLTDRSAASSAANASARDGRGAKTAGSVTASAAVGASAGAQTTAAGCGASNAPSAGAELTGTTVA